MRHAVTPLLTKETGAVSTQYVQVADANAADVTHRQVTDRTAICRVVNAQIGENASGSPTDSLCNAIVIAPVYARVVKLHGKLETGVSLARTLNQRRRSTILQ